MTLDSTTTAQLVALAVIAVCAALVSWLFVWGLVKAGDKPPQVTLVLALAMLSLVALTIGAITGSDAAYAAAAAGVGAIAGGVTSSFTEGTRQYRMREREADDDDRPDPGSA